ncbi:MAG: hypothetical protein SGPRY_011009 [Prymnesium sp.]
MQRFTFDDFFSHPFLAAGLKSHSPVEHPPTSSPSASAASLPPTTHTTPPMSRVESAPLHVFQAALAAMPPAPSGNDALCDTKPTPPSALAGRSADAPAPSRPQRSDGSEEKVPPPPPSSDPQVGPQLSTIRELSAHKPVPLSLVPAPSPQASPVSSPSPMAKPTQPSPAQTPHPSQLLHTPNPTHSFAQQSKSPQSAPSARADAPSAASPLSTTQRMSAQEPPSFQALSETSPNTRLLLASSKQPSSPAAASRTSPQLAPELTRTPSRRRSQCEQTAAFAPSPQPSVSSHSSSPDHTSSSPTLETPAEFQLIPAMPLPPQWGSPQRLPALLHPSPCLPSAQLPYHLNAPGRPATIFPLVPRQASPPGQLTHRELEGERACAEPPLCSCAASACAAQMGGADDHRCVPTGAATAACSIALANAPSAANPKQLVPVSLPSNESSGKRSGAALYDRSLDGIDAECAACIPSLNPLPTSLWPSHINLFYSLNLLASHLSPNLNILSSLLSPNVNLLPSLLSRHLNLLLPTYRLSRVALPQPPLHPASPPSLP